jgi:hypothetical protein
MKKIETAQEAACAIAQLTPRKIELLVAGLKAQHPNLTHMSDKEVRQFLTDYITNNQ